MPIAIVGTGRSGTSMVARFLNICGVYLGEAADLASQDEWNPKGFWEHAGIYELNERLLEAVGGSYENPPRLALGWEYDSALDSLYTEACILIEQKFSGHAEWAWKLPRAISTLPFWRRVVPDLKFVVCVRNPIDYAQSLSKYYKVSLEHALDLWQFYNLQVLSTTPCEARIITFYEDYFPDYNAGLNPLLKWLGVHREEVHGSIDAELADFHDPNLQHHSTQFHELIANPQVPYLIKETYLQMLADSSDGADLPILKHAETYLPLLRQVVSPDTVNRSAEKRLRERIDVLEASIQQLDRQRAEIDNRSKQLEQILNSRTHRIAARVCEFLIRHPLRGLRHRAAEPTFALKPAPSTQREHAAV